MTTLLLLGAGGLGRETAELVRAAQAAGAAWELGGFLDDAPGLVGQRVAGLPVRGRIASAVDHPRACLAVTMARSGDPACRRRIVCALAQREERFPTLVHPTAALAASTSVGAGSILMATVTATADVTIGSFVVAMPAVTFTHDDVLGDFATFGAGARLSGGVTVGEAAYVGAGALVREGCRIGDGALVGMGSVVLSDVPAGEVWAGVPARRLRTVPKPGDP